MHAVSFAIPSVPIVKDKMRWFDWTHTYAHNFDDGRLYTRHVSWIQTHDFWLFGKHVELRRFPRHGRWLLDY